MPTPIAPPSTDSAVRSMPTTDRATSKPTNTRVTRVALLTALRNDSSPPLADLSRRVSMTDEIHSVIKSTTPAVIAPSSMARTDSVVAPTFHLIWSSSSSTTGSSPLTHSSMATQAIHDMERSSVLTSGASLNTTCNTLTPRRINASASNTGIATLKTASANMRDSRTLALYAKNSNNSGNSTPSMILRPNKIEVWSGLPKARRARLTSSQASITQASRIPNSTSAAGCVSAANHSSRLSIVPVGRLDFGGSKPTGSNAARAEPASAMLKLKYLKTLSFGHVADQTGQCGLRFSIKA